MPPIHKTLVALLALLFCTVPILVAEDLGSQTIVLYNGSMTESKDLARFYAEKRNIPSKNLLGLDLPQTEAITRVVYRDALEKPLLKWIEKNEFFTLQPDWKKHVKEENYKPVRESSIRYATLCYGIPLKILEDPKIKETGTERFVAEVRRNDAAVDSELALIPLAQTKLPLIGPFVNPAFAATNATALNPTNGLLIVARLDGPSVQIARGLVEKALEAERDGCWGRAYFDARGLTNGDYKIGDDWLRACADISRHYGFDTILDDRPATIAPSYPMSQIALYAGWYDSDVSGPFTRQAVEFMPGAIAYHLHSFSAQSIRTPSQHWVGPLLAKGVTATMGCVEEPYLQGTPNIHVFFARLMALGFTFGEAALAAQPSLSWQTTVVGDPLYRPFGQNPGKLHDDLNARKSRLVDWSHLRVINIQLSRGASPADGIAYIKDLFVSEPGTQRSPVIHEKLGDLLQISGKLEDAIEPYQKALEMNPTPQQRTRLTLQVVRLMNMQGKEAEAYDVLKKFVVDPPDYADLANVYKTLITLGEKLKKTEDVSQFQTALARLK